MPLDLDALTLDDVAAHVGGTVVGPDTIDVRGVQLALIRGGTVTLGWDPSRPSGLSDAQLAAHAAADDGGEPLPSMLGYYLSPTRVVTLAPFLLEIEPRSTAGWAADLGDDLLAGVAARLAGEGFRLATDDEWEHAVRAGTTTMFRWGDDWPDGVPFGDETRFTGHLAPAGSGLRLLSDPYQVEVVAAPLGLRGGDGGSTVCGGRPAPEAWITFASAFRWPRELWEDVIDVSLDNGFVRRALSL